MPSGAVAGVMKFFSMCVSSASLMVGAVDCIVLAEPVSWTTLTVVFLSYRRWFNPSLLVVPTEKVAAVPSVAGIAMEVTVLKAFLPTMAVVSPSTNWKSSVIVAPSTLVPVIVITPFPISAAVPPGVTDSTRGTSGSVMLVVTV